MNEKDLQYVINAVNAAWDRGFKASLVVHSDGKSSIVVHIPYIPLRLLDEEKVFMKTSRLNEMLKPKNMEIVSVIVSKIKTLVRYEIIKIVVD